MQVFRNFYPILIIVWIDYSVKRNLDISVFFGSNDLRLKRKSLCPAFGAQMKRESYDKLKILSGLMPFSTFRLKEFSYSLIKLFTETRFLVKLKAYFLNYLGYFFGSRNTNSL